MLRASLLAAICVAGLPAWAAVPTWGQCGGMTYTGDTVCAAGTACVFLNSWFSQCIPGATASASSSVRTSTLPSTTSRPTSVSSSSVAASSTASASSPSSTGFVTISGQKFMLDGEEFTVVGENAYWIGLFNYGVADVDKAYQDIVNAGSTVVRTLGFNDVTPANIAEYPVYYQSWANGTGTINLGPNGLQNFDQVVARAKAHGLRLLVTLTNNWSDYGGMDVYVQQILGSTFHDLFYTDPQVIAAFKKYINGFVSRYVDEPTILAWELANEPRCAGSTGVTTGNCTNPTITKWIAEISAYIKSIDPNHLVGVGDEGFINDPGNPSYPYQGTLGIDFEANLQIPTIDFGTFHMYPESWGQTNDPSAVGWGNQWISDHAAMGRSAGKPVIMEEFGVTIADQASTYAEWYDTVISTGLAGDLIWQAGSHLPGGDTPNDGYAEYPDGDVYPIIQQHAAALKARG